MIAGAAAEWIVLKFGGTSVASLPNWRNIAHVVRERRVGGARILVVHSALSGVTDRLEKLLVAALVASTCRCWRLSRSVIGCWPMSWKSAFLRRLPGIWPGFASYSMALRAAAQ